MTMTWGGTASVAEVEALDHTPFATPTWFEYRVTSEDEARTLYARADVIGAESIHHFWFEPWHPDGGVVRVLFPADASEYGAWKLKLGLAGTVSYAPWDAQPDVDQYGPELWALMMRYHEATGRLALSHACSVDKAWLLRKAVHCELNTHRLDVREEFWWSLRFAWKRVKTAWMYRRWPRVPGTHPDEGQWWRR